LPRPVVEPTLKSFGGIFGSDNDRGAQAMHTRIKAAEPISDRISVRYAAALALGMALIAIAEAISPARAQAGETTRPSWDPAQFLLNAFLLPALEQGALPLRWFDPRPALH
jgi:hypothetical protein